MKRSGGFRRKVIAKYRKLQETSENKIIQKKCDIGNKTSGSVHVFSNCQNTVTETDRSQESNSCSFSSVLTETFLEEASNEDQENWCETHTEDENYEFRENIRQWAVKCNIPQAHLHDLFSIVNKRLPFVLPKDPRTLLKTNALEICISSICSGHYWHNGLKIQLKNILEEIIEVPTQISLNINIDGLPIYNSSRHQLWPILCNIFELSNISPIVIGIYEGQSKPSDLSAYLGPTVSELKELENGLDVTTKQGKSCKVDVKVRAFLCDSPARALIKGVANFNAKDGCLKCTIQGEYSHDTHTVTFPGTNHPKRTDNDFRLKKYGNHHKVEVDFCTAEPQNKMVSNSLNPTDDIRHEHSDHA
ncbi:hypothetical protein ABMA28_014574 [Loxostege sticticalis]|uniref:Uncharacterized protein n=1 Tax=Loxostege sticticalis TaxID=481309 RepID=A0ABD0THB5_LOXSC